MTTGVFGAGEDLASGVRTAGDRAAMTKGWGRIQVQMQWAMEEGEPENLEGEDWRRRGDLRHVRLCCLAYKGLLALALPRGETTHARGEYMSPNIFL